MSEQHHSGIAIGVKGNHVPNCVRHRAARTAAAFTLIELLVVVSIIALLISILLPSLKKAKDQAKGVVCSAMIGGTLRGMVTYTAEWNGWIPGSPGTTGSVLLGLDSPPASEEEDMPESPTQIFDWAGPIAGANGVLPSNRADRHKVLVEELFVCPANKFPSEPYTPSMTGPQGNFGIVKMNSYLSVRQLLLWAPEFPFGPGSAWGEHAPFPEATYNFNIGGDSVLVPKGHKPNIDRMVNPSDKVFLADGSRFTTDENLVDHDIRWDAPSGGAFSDGGPALAPEFLKSYKLEDPANAYSYRHFSGNQRAIVAGRFDGSTVLMSKRQSRHPVPWFPKGTLIKSGEEFNDETRALIESNNSDGSDYNYKVPR